MISTVRVAPSYQAADICYQGTPEWSMSSFSVGKRRPLTRGRPSVLAEQTRRRRFIEARLQTQTGYEGNRLRQRLAEVRQVQDGVAPLSPSSTKGRRGIQ